MSTNGQRSGSGGDPTNRLIESVDQMVRWPFQMTGATWDLMMQGMQAVTGSTGSGNRDRGNSYSSSSASFSSSDRSSPDRSTGSSSGPSWTSYFTGQSDQDLRGDDLKYVIWSIIFTKPGFESVLEPQHEDLIGYETDGTSFAAVKIAKFLERARHGHAEKPTAWRESGYAVEAHYKSDERRTETTVISTPVASSSASEKQSASGRDKEKGWRIPAEDQKYIKFLYRVDRRLPKQEAEIVERVTIERNTTKIV